MSATVLKFLGRFQVWSYSVSHGQLLLRSPKSRERATQVDILFKNVASMQLPAMFDDIEIRKVRADELPSAPQLGALESMGREIYRITGRNVDGYVVAGAVVADERNLEYDAVSPLLQM